MICLVLQCEKSRRQSPSNYTDKSTVEFLPGTLIEARFGHEVTDQLGIVRDSALWDRFTLFLQKAGAPLDNNLCERALKKAILHPKNSLFYKTENGAHVGDIFMSLIYTCQTLRR